MNIDNVYLANIYVKTGETYENYRGPLNFDIVSNGSIFKETIVYDTSKTCKLCYIDLVTGKKYDKFSLNDCYKIGECYIKIESLIPITSVLALNKKNMSKKRILKMYNENIKNTKNNK